MWMVVNKESGEVKKRDLATKPTPGPGEDVVQHPSGSGFTWSPALHGFIRAQTVAEVQAELIDQVKAEGERRRMLVMSPGGSKKTVYSLKQSEVDAWNDLGSTLATALTAFLGLSLVKQRRKFRFALAEAALRGEANPAAAIARFATGSDAANAEAARIEAIEQAGVASVKAATTVGAKRAAYAAINWNSSA
jgi:hypothetical protein